MIRGHRRRRGGEERRQPRAPAQLAETEKQIRAWEERLNQIGDEMEPPPGRREPSSA